MFSLIETKNLIKLSSELIWPNVNSESKGIRDPLCSKDNSFILNFISFAYLRKIESM